MKGGSDREACLAAAKPAVQSCVRSKMAGAGGANAGPMNSSNPKFRTWCNNTGGSYRNDQRFALREAAGCFTTKSHRPH
jgi:hypothetical protein